MTILGTFVKYSCVFLPNETQLVNIVIIDSIIDWLTLPRHITFCNVYNQENYIICRDAG